MGATAQLSETSVAGEPLDGAVEQNLARRRLLRRGLVAFSSFEVTRKRGKCRRLLLTCSGRRKRGDIDADREEPLKRNPSAYTQDRVCTSPSSGSSRCPSNDSSCYMLRSRRP
ncbi:hypothetical protein BHE74_00027770 [Ensete ventricosum]|nr:hypothetical protein BHE74_00027770 [Ensete ventricosum]RZS04430.1 hypothetical protein BHM03_00034750 [Ensete ventricosum]